MAGLLREDLGAQRAFARRHAGLVEGQRLLGMTALLGQHDVSVGAVRRELERLAGELDPAAPARLERAVHQVLRLFERGRRGGRHLVDGPGEPLAQRCVGVFQGLERRRL